MCIFDSFKQENILQVWKDLMIFAIAIGYILIFTDQFVLFVFQIVC